VAVTHPRKLCRFNSCPTHMDGLAIRRTGCSHGPFVYRFEDAGPSSRKDGFDSHAGYLAKWWNGRHATLRTSCPSGVGVRFSPWSLRSGLEPGFQHGLISRSTPVRIRPPQFHGRVRKVEKRPGREPGESLRVRFPPRLLLMIPLSSGKDSWPTSRQRWFESIRDY
jgi:hypothetical protein